MGVAGEVGDLPDLHIAGRGCLRGRIEIGPAELARVVGTFVPSIWVEASVGVEGLVQGELPGARDR